MKKKLNLIRYIKKKILLVIYSINPSLKHKIILAEIKKSHEQKKKTAILIGFSDWKTWMKEVLKDYNVIFLGHSPKVSTSLLELIPKFYQPSVFCWSYKYPQELNKICNTHKINITFVEDGFIRGSGLGIAKTNPMSLVFDKKAMHFDSSKVSELDDLLNSYELTEEDYEFAEMFKDAFSKGVTKYIRAESGASIINEYNLADEHIVVVLGQVEDDLSIHYGANHFYSGNDLVLIAALENPNSRILYRPHPESLQRSKKHYSKPEDVSNMCDIIDSRWSLQETLEVADCVYTVTSFSGFEAVLLGKKVELFGLPFYGGWGFTNDRHNIELGHKRKKELTKEQVLAIVMVHYSQYFHPVTMEKITPLKALSFASNLAQKLTAKSNRNKSLVLNEVQQIHSASNNEKGFCCCVKNLNQ